MAETTLQPPAPAPAPAPAPVMDVVAPPPLAQPPAEPARAAALSPAAPAQADAPAPVKPKPAPKQGVTAAIIATVIIVLGLAALAVIAYIKQK